METKLYYTDCIRCEEVAITYQYYNLYENMSMNPRHENEENLLVRIANSACAFYKVHTLREC